MNAPGCNLKKANESVKTYFAAFPLDHSHFKNNMSALLSLAELDACQDLAHMLRDG